MKSHVHRLLLVDNDAIAIDSTLYGDAEKCVVPDFAIVGTSRGAQRGAAGECQGYSGSG